MFHRLALAAFAALSLSLAPLAAQAREEPAAAYARADAQEARDRVVVTKAMDDFNARGAIGLAPHMRSLQKVLDNLPASYPLIETRDGVIISRKADPVLGGLLPLLGAAKDGKTVTLLTRSNVYGDAAWLLAWAAVEARDPERALRVLEPVMAAQPNNPALVAERGSALNLLRRWQESYDNYDSALKAGEPMDDGLRAVLLRGRGFALIELGRLDEAEADYRESLKLVPGHGGALNELTYIEQQRAGKPKVAADVFTAKEARELGGQAPADDK